MITCPICMRQLKAGRCACPECHREAVCSNGRLEELGAATGASTNRESGSEQRMVSIQRRTTPTGEAANFMKKTRQDIDLPLLRKRLQYAFGLLRYTGDRKQQKREDADMAKSALRMSIEQLKGVR